MLLWLLMITNIELFTPCFGHPNCWLASTILGVFIGSWMHFQPLIQCWLLTDVCVRGVCGCLETHSVWRNGCQKCKPGLFFFLEEVACGLLLVLGYFGKLLSVKEFLTKGWAIYCTNQRINQWEADTPSPSLGRGRHRGGDRADGPG